MVESQEIYYSNGFSDKVKKLVEGGSVNLHVISDFDWTLTRKLDDEGEVLPNSISILRNGNYLSSDYKRISLDLFNKYCPKEKDPTLSLNERKKSMLEWWNTHLKLMISSGISKRIVEGLVSDYPKFFRDGCDELFGITSTYNVPFLIFSAGLGDVVDGNLANNGWLEENVFTLSNFYNFDSFGNVTGYKGDIIHSLNKDEHLVRHRIYCDKVSERKNVILLGDSLGDIEMSNGLEHDVVLKIGYFNGGNGALLEQYKSSYDCVIIGDNADLSIVVELLEKICGD